jgi:tetratricopeptide (TPR) repeat protein
LPYTLNGIGTHYYGRSNQSAHVGACKSCKRSATLASYDTREWFCVLFIPLIPLTKFRILDECSSCRRHFRMKASEFQDKMQKSVAPLREAIQRSPRDPQPYIDLVRTFIGWKMRAEAERELQSAAALFPQNVELLLLSADLRVERADFDGALPLYERAHAVDPQNGDATYGYAWVLHQMQRHEQAVPALQLAVSQGANKIGSLYLLGTSQMKLSRWNDALHAYQQLLSLEPKYMADKKLLRLVRECKQHLGYELTDAERRAGRRWWPFGGKTKPAKLQSAPTLVRPSLRYAGLAILAVSVVSVVFYAWDRKSNIKLYFDNGLDRVVQIDVDGRRFELARNAPRGEEMKEGAHTVVVRETGGKEIERLTFRLDETSIFDAAMHDRFFVYNVSGQKVYRRATHGYSPSPQNASYSEELIGMQRFFEQRDVDYPFQAPPETISMDAGSSVEHKVSFNTANEITLSRYALIRLREGKKDEAKVAMERAAATRPCDTPTRRTQVYFEAVVDSPAAASATAHQWIADCQQDDLEAHRAYQDVNREQGHNEALRAEYRKSLAAAPDSAKAHYLYGRVVADPAAAAVEYQQAIRLDPKMVWPRVALGHAYGLMNRHQEAFREYATALDMDGRDSSVLTDYSTAAIANGTPDAAVAKIDEVRKANPKEFTALDARWLLAVAMHDWDTAEAIQKTLSPIEGEQSAWWRNTKMLRFKDDPSVDAHIDVAMRSRELRAVAVTARIERLIETGAFAESAALAAEHAKELDPTATALFEAYAAGGLLMHGEAAAAARVLDDAQKALEGAPRSREARIASAVIGGVRGSMPVDAMMSFARDEEAMPHAWFVSAVRAAVTHDRAREVESLRRSVQSAPELEFPYLELKTMLASFSAGTRDQPVQSAAKR